jgi:hypothetical protein
VQRSLCVPSLKLAGQIVKWCDLLPQSCRETIVRCADQSSRIQQARFFRSAVVNSDVITFDAASRSDARRLCLGVIYQQQVMAATKISKHLRVHTQTCDVNSDNRSSSIRQ